MPPNEAAAFFQNLSIGHTYCFAFKRDDATINDPTVKYTVVEADQNDDGSLSRIKLQPKKMSNGANAGDFFYLPVDTAHIWSITRRTVAREGNVEDPHFQVNPDAGGHDDADPKPWVEPITNLHSAFNGAFGEQRDANEAAIAAQSKINEKTERSIKNLAATNQKMVASMDDMKNMLTELAAAREPAAGRRRGARPAAAAAAAAEDDDDDDHNDDDDTNQSSSDDDDDLVRAAQNRQTKHSVSVYVDASDAQQCMVYIRRLTEIARTVNPDEHYMFFFSAIKLSTTRFIDAWKGYFAEYARLIGANNHFIRDKDRSLKQLKRAHAHVTLVKTSDATVLYSAIQIFKHEMYEITRNALRADRIAGNALDCIESVFDSVYNRASSSKKVVSYTSFAEHTTLCITTAAKRPTAPSDRRGGENARSAAAAPRAPSANRREDRQKSADKREETKLKAIIEQVTALMAASKNAPPK